MANTASEEVPDEFVFDRMQQPSSRIRLISVPPIDSRFSLIDCDLQTHELGESQYLAFFESKEDTGPKSHVILCNGVLRSVTALQHETLSRCSGLSTEWVWLAGLCVNLDDAEETRDQESLVPEIFANAAGVSDTNMFRRFAPSSVQINPGDIRLLEMFPSPDEDSTVQARVFPVTIATDLEHHPYSYLFIKEELTEVSPADHTEILCNGQLHTVTSHVSDGLQGLRAEGKLKVWCRVVCIDLGNLEEVKYHKEIDDRIRELANYRCTVEVSFQDEPLLASPAMIRLLYLHPAVEKSDVIMVDVKQYLLESSPSYTALSYVWGPENLTSAIFTSDGRTIRVTESLLLALGYARKQGVTQIWADQICIDQKDDKEKSQQILIMTNIYRRADRVLLNLGISWDFERKEFWDYLPVLLKILALTKRVLRCVRPEWPFAEPGEFSKFGIPSESHTCWKAWRQMRRMDWFRRAWVIQEAAVGVQIDVVFNDRPYSWGDLVDANNATHGVGADTLAFIGFAALEGIGDLREASPGAYTLLDLMMEFRMAGSKDPRDKIYALRGLSSDILQTPLPDYEKSVEEIYNEYARYFVRSGQGMQLIGQAGLMDQPRNAALPSWVPDWHGGSEEHPMTFFNKDNGPHLALRLLAVKCRYPHSHVELTDDPRVISALGKVMGRSMAIQEWTEKSEAFPGADGIPAYVVATRRRVKSAELLMAQSNSVHGLYATPQGAKVALLTTLLGGDYTVEGFHEEAYSYTPGEEGAPIDWSRPIGNLDNAIAQRLDHRRFCVASNGWIGLVPHMTRSDDHVVVLKGSHAPFIMRPSLNPDHQTYQIIGDAYFHNMSEPNLMKIMEQDSYEILIE